MVTLYYITVYTDTSKKLNKIFISIYQIHDIVNSSMIRNLNSIMWYKIINYVSPPPRRCCNFRRTNVVKLLPAYNIHIVTACYCVYLTCLSGCSGTVELFVASATYDDIEYYLRHNKRFRHPYHLPHANKLTCSQ